MLNVVVPQQSGGRKRVVSKRVVLAEVPRRYQRGSSPAVPTTRTRSKCNLAVQAGTKKKNEGTFGFSPVPKTGTRAQSPKKKTFTKPPFWGAPKASHIKASHPHFPHFPRYRVRIFRVFVLRSLLKPLFSWGGRDVRIFRIFPLSGLNR